MQSQAGKKFCGECGTELVEAASFCGQCGAIVSHHFSQQSESVSSEKTIKRKSRKKFWFIIPTITILIFGAVFLVILYMVDEFSPTSVNAIAFSPDETQLVSVGPDRYLQLWDITTGKSIIRRKLSAGIKKALAWDPHGNFIALAINSEIQFFNPVSLKNISSISVAPDEIKSLCIDPNGRTVYSITNRLGISVWDYEKNERLGGMEDLPDRLISYAGFNNNCQEIAVIETGSIPNSNDDSSTIHKYLTVYDRINMETRWNIHFDDVLSDDPDLAGISPDGKIAFTIESYDQKVKTRNIDTEETIESILSNPVYPTALAMGVTKYFALGGREGLINIYNGHGKYQKTLQHGSRLWIALLPLKI